MIVALNQSVPSTKVTRFASSQKNLPSQPEADKFTPQPPHGKKKTKGLPTWAKWLTAFAISAVALPLVPRLVPPEPTKPISQPQPISAARGAESDLTAAYHHQAALLPGLGEVLLQHNQLNITASEKEQLLDMIPDLKETHAFLRENEGITPERLRNPNTNPSDNQVKQLRAYFNKARKMNNLLQAILLRNAQVAGELLGNNPLWQQYRQQSQQVRNAGEAYKVALERFQQEQGTPYRPVWLVDMLPDFWRGDDGREVEIWR